MGAGVALGAPSLWADTCDDDLRPRPPLPGDVDADVAIIGAGFTGLWTAHHLLRHDPGLRVVVIEREIAGWGASGRNGGWCSALFAAPWPRVAREHGRDAALRLRRALEATVEGVGAWCTEHGVDAHFHKGGTLTLARDPAQVARARADAVSDRAHGGTDTVWLDADTASRRVAASAVLGAVFSPHCAAVHPARLVRGLARVVERQGGRVFERTAAVHFEPGLVMTQHGAVRAAVVIRATEGYTPLLAKQRAVLAPVWSLVIATEPLPPDSWAQLRWADRETVSDARNLIVYAQRTADDRIVFGGRGAPYRFGSRTDGSRGHQRTFAHLDREMRSVFPCVRDARVTHRWGGVIGVPRDWMPAVVFDRGSGIGYAGGYVGDGVGCSALAGRTLADLVLGRDTDETHLPWVGHRWPRWEPEPLRWLGIRGITALMASADRTESRSGRPSRRSAWAKRVVGG